MDAERKEYLKELASEYGVPLKQVVMLAELLGEDEDEDGLISELEDLSLMQRKG